jgi:predicted alpha/beta superfamily hydrolase
MKKLVLLFIFIPFSIFSQKNITYKKYNSALLNAERIIKVYVPESYETEKDKNYPVAVIFDADYLFDIYVANAKLFASTDEAPEQIIVGIMQNQHKERYADCDFSIDTGLPNEESAKFYGFVRDELLPFIDDNYRTSMFKTIVGNTITANFINYFFLESNHVFNAYININPTYAPGIAEKIEAKTQSLTEDIFYYVCSGDYIRSSKKKKAINETVNLLKLSEIEKFHFKYDNFKNATKTSAIGQSLPSAMSLIFQPYSGISKEEFDKVIADMSPAEAIEYLEKKYVEIDYLFGSNLNIREHDIYMVEPIIIDKEEGNYLEEFGKMINRLYPDSPLGDYYIGLYYETGYNYKKALKYYKNGYAKIGSDNENADAYYQNIERVLDKKRAFKLGLPVGGEEPADDNQEKN